MHLGSVAVLLTIALQCVRPGLGGSPHDRQTSEHTKVSAGEPGFDLLFVTNEEEFEDVQIALSSPVPAWLRGTYMRNGPGRFEFGPRSVVHLFDGFAKISMWKFQGNNTVTFFTKFIQSSQYKGSSQKKTIVPYLMLYGVDPEFNEAEKLLAMVRMMDNMVVNVYSFLNPDTGEYQIGALNDIWKMYEISMKNLSTLQLVDPKLNTCDKVVYDNSHHKNDKEINIGQKKHQKQSGVWSRIFNPLKSVLRSETDKSTKTTSAHKCRNNHGGLAGVGEIFISLLSTSHPVPEFGTKNHLTFQLHFALLPGQKHEISLVRMTSIENREQIARWAVDTPIPYMHSFSVTPNKAILLASPFYIRSVACIVATATPFRCLDWDNSAISHIYIVDLKSKKVTTIQLAPPAYIMLHHANAYELDEHKIIVDGPGYSSADMVFQLTLDIMKDPAKRSKFPIDASFRRIAIDLEDNSASMTAYDNTPSPPLSSRLDFPVINEAYRGQHYCYVYGYVWKADNKTFSNMVLVKKNVCSNNGTGDKYWHVPGSYPLEPWFVADPSGSAEDDGILLVPGHDGQQGRSVLNVHDAKTLKLISQAVAPTYIPYSFHGRYFPEG